MNLKNTLLILLCTINAQVFAAAESWIRTKPSQHNVAASINRLVIYQAEYSPYADVADDAKRPVAESFFNLTEQEIAAYLHLHPNRSSRYLAAYAEAKRLCPCASPQATLIAIRLRKRPTAFAQKLVLKIDSIQEDIKHAHELPTLSIKPYFIEDSIDPFAQLYTFDN
jgi:hypothetical protein